MLIKYKQMPLQCHKANSKVASEDTKDPEKKKV